MLLELKAEIFKLIQDKAFIRNLSLTSLIAIAFLCSLSALQSKTIQTIAPRAELAIAISNN